MDEHTPLIHTPSTAQRRRFKYRFQFMRSKGAVLVIIIDALIKWFGAYILYTTAIIRLMEFNDSIMLGNFDVGYMALLFFPIIGLIGDMCVGRYRMILGSMLFCLVMWIVTVIVVTLLCVYTETHSVLFGTISLIVLGVSFIGIAGIESIIIPFNIDQLMGASGDELSATIYWHYFTELIPQIVFVVFDSLSYYKFMYVSTLLMVSLSIGGLSLVLALSILFIFNHWLDTTPQFFNPIKDIFQVLNYARKNKYPRNRSALTYWENSVPSRLDLGKDKYGGPFTVEQVEDVKTVFRLLPVLISVSGIGFSATHLNVTVSIEDYAFDEGSYILYAMFILIHLFILYPCCSKYIPSMLKRITLGLVFGLLTPIGCIIIQLIFLHSGPSSIPSYYQWIIVIIFTITYSIAEFLIRVTSIEFIVAQSPKSMRGVMVGLWYASLGVGRLSREFVIYLVSKIIGNDNNADAMNIVSFVILLLILILFVIFVKCYKFRIRENIVPVRQIAEEHYERYQEQSDEYRRARELSYTCTDSYSVCQ